MKDLKKLILESLLAKVNGEEEKEEEVEAKAPEANENSKAMSGLVAKLMGDDNEEEDIDEDETDKVDGKVVMPKKDFKKEHESLVAKLKEKDPTKLDKEAEEQEGELEDVEEEEPKDPKALVKLAILMMKKKKKE